jgi:drug/metabolite transporter (DMT)-like permease
MKAKLYLLTSMLIWGSIGLFVRKAGLPSATLAFFRGVVGGAFMLCAALAMRRPPSLPAIRKNLPRLAAAGAVLGANWILIFESYRFATVSLATLVYFFAPVFVMLLSPLVLGERLTAGKLACVATAAAGLFLVVGADFSAGGDSLRGVLLALAAACLYTIGLFINKFIRGIRGVDDTLVQLFATAAVLLPYVLVKDGVPKVPSGGTLFIVLLLCLVHTGLAYLLYFTTLPALSAQTAAMLSYVNPVAAVILSAVFLHERIGILQLCGAALVLGSTALMARGKEKKPPAKMRRHA